MYNRLASELRPSDCIDLWVSYCYSSEINQTLSTYIQILSTFKSNFYKQSWDYHCRLFLSFSDERLFTGREHPERRCVLSHFFFLFFFIKFNFFSPLSNRFEIRGRAGLGSAEHLASGVPTLNKLSGFEIIVQKKKKEIQNVCLTTLIPKVKTNKPNLTLLPLLSVFVVVRVLPPQLGGVHVNQRLNQSPQDTCWGGVRVQLERNIRPINYYRNHNATAEWGLYVKCTLNIAMRWAGEEVCDLFINIKLLLLIWKTSFLALFFNIFVFFERVLHTVEVPLRVSVWHFWYNGHNMKARNKTSLVILDMSGRIISNSDLWCCFGGLHDFWDAATKARFI